MLPHHTKTSQMSSPLLLRVWLKAGLVLFTVLTQTHFPSTNHIFLSMHHARETLIMWAVEYQPHFPLQNKSSPENVKSPLPPVLITAKNYILFSLRFSLF